MAQIIVCCAQKGGCAKTVTVHNLSYDAVVIGHTQFEKIPLSPERQRSIIQQQIDDVVDGIESHYDQVYSGSVESNGAIGEVLESLFMRFNLEFPADYRSRSMSVSDVVVLHENGNDRAYFCDSIGFAEVPQFFQSGLVVTMDTDGLAVDGHFGTWHSIDTKQIGGKGFYLMEHDEYGDEAASIIVDATGKLVAEDLWEGFTPEIVAMIAQEQGLHADLENYLAAAEGYSEENYNQIDGRMDTQSKLTPGDDTESQPEKQPNQKPSVLEKLQQKKDAVEEQKKLPPLPQRETGRDHTTLE